MSINKLSHQEEYVRRQDCIYTTIHVDSKLQRLEADLMKTKHADYAFLSPAELTRIFRREYTKQFQHYFGKYYDYRRREYFLGLKHAELFQNNSTTINSLWKARQQADRLGMKYEMYVSLAFKYLVDERNYKRYPRPNQLYSEHVIAAVISKRDEYSEAGILSYGFPTTSDPRFKNDNFCGEPAQNTYIERQLQRISDADTDELKTKRLIAFCLNRVTLPKNVIESKFDMDRSAIVKKWDGEEEPYTDGVNQNDFRRACYGLPLAKIGETTCVVCPMVDECCEESAVVRKRVVEKVGSINPKAERKKDLARERKRRQRERDRAARKEVNTHPAA